MGQLERTVVQLWEARRLAARGNVPHGRLALLLLDNAAEMSLRRTAQAGITLAEMYNDLARITQDVALDSQEDQRLRREIESATITPRQKKQIERNFEALVDYVFGDEKFPLASEFAECLKILHRYRNAAYHRDMVRVDVLGPAVQILFFLCCHLLKNERQIVREINQAPSAILEVFGDSPPNSSWPANSFDTQTLANHVADRLLAELDLDHRGIAEALSEHLIARLDGLLRDLDEVGRNVPPGITREAALRLVQQIPREYEGFDIVWPDDFWTRPLPVTEELIGEWCSKARSLRGISIAHDALRSFAEIERPLEMIEEPMARLILDFSHLQQRRLDEFRGK